jgi:hypothetical protein
MTSNRPDTSGFTVQAFNQRSCNSRTTVSEIAPGYFGFARNSLAPSIRAWPYLLRVSKRRRRPLVARDSQDGHESTKHIKTWNFGQIQIQQDCCGSGKRARSA